MGVNLGDRSCELLEHTVGSLEGVATGPRIGGQACTGSTSTGRYGKLGEQQFP